MMKMTTRLSFALAIGSLLAGVASAGTLEPPPGPVSATRPPDRCFDNGNRFVDCGNGTVKDFKTGLFWLKNANCFGLQNWATANISAANLGQGQCGLTDGSLPGDWRLPTLGCAGGNCQPIETGTGEFVSIFNSAACNVAPYVLDAPGLECPTVGSASQFSGVQSWAYWSSSPYVSSPHLAWYLSTDEGGVGFGFDKSTTWYVWPVRGGP
jgi:hypothetical protein